MPFPQFSLFSVTAVFLISEELSSNAIGTLPSMCYVFNYLTLSIPPTQTYHARWFLLFVNWPEHFFWALKIILKSLSEFCFGKHWKSAWQLILFQIWNHERPTLLSLAFSEIGRQMRKFCCGKQIKNYLKKVFRTQRALRVFGVRTHFIVFFLTLICLNSVVIVSLSEKVLELELLSNIWG